MQRILLLWITVIICLDMIPSNNETAVCKEKGKSFQLVLGSQENPISDALFVQERKKNHHPRSECLLLPTKGLSLNEMTPLVVGANPENDI